MSFWRRKASLIVLVLAFGIQAGLGRKGDDRPTAREIHAPDLLDAKYGPYERNVLDLWMAQSDRPTPLLIYFHGGGFLGGDKSSVNLELLERCLKAGISVAAANYRFSNQQPFPGPMLDGARAIQFIRSKAKEWHIDPSRIAATGNSAGAGMSLWIGFHDDLADLGSQDPVLLQSSRLSCMLVDGAQSTYDPRVIKELIGGRAHEHPALFPFYGLKPEELDTPKAYALFEQASPITYVSPGDPPVFMFYTEADEPLPPDCKPGQGIHHPKFGAFLKARMDPMGIECLVRHRDEYQEGDGVLSDMMAFLQNHLGTEH